MGITILLTLRSIGATLVILALALDVWYAEQDRFDKALNGYSPELLKLTFWLGFAIVVIAQIGIWIG
jgi:hypothetical protein